MDAAPAPKTPVSAWMGLLEALLATVAGAALIRLLIGLGGWATSLAPAVWIYLPLIALLPRRGISLAAHGFALEAWRRGLGSLLAAVAIVLIPFALAVLAWRGIAADPEYFRPGRLAGLALAQLLLVAVPEELFFRGYIQERLQAPAGGRLGGAAPAILLGALLFALAHVMVEAGWLRAAVFFPGLVMGWLRERSGGLLAPAGFHWLSNMLWLALMS